MLSITAPKSGICYSSYKMATELFKNSDWKSKSTSLPKKHRNKNTYYLEFTNHSVVLLPTENGHQLSTESILTILKENCNYLKLCGINLTGDLQLTKEKSQIKHLEVEKCQAEEFQHEVLAKLIGSCYSLEKLSLRHLQLNSEVIKTLCLNNGQTLRSLDLSKFYILNTDALWHITKYCVNLKELSVENTYLSGTETLYLINNLQPKIEKLNLSILPITDGHIEALVNRCNQIKGLSLKSSGPITDTAVTCIINKLRNTLTTLNLSGCRQISRSKLLELKSMPQLKHLKISCNDRELEGLQKKFSSLKVHQAK